MRKHLRAAVLVAGALALALTTLSPAFARPGKGKGSHNLMVWLSPSGTTADAWGKAKFKFTRSQTRLTVETHGLTPGDYKVLVGGVEIGTFPVRVDSDSGSEFGRFVAQSRGSDPVDFDPRGKSLAVVSAGTNETELECEDFPEDKSEEMDKVEVEASLDNTGLVPAASGKAEFEEFRGRTKFEVDVLGLAAGTYDLLVGGVVKGQIVVGADGEGEIEFDSLPEGVGDDDSPGEESDLLLDFDPRGQSIDVAQGTNVYLTLAAFPAS